MRRRRLLVFVLIASAIVVAATAAQVDEARRRADAVATTTSSAVPHRGHQPAVASNAPARDTGLVAFRGTRSNWRDRLLSGGAAILAGAVALAALLRRRALIGIAGHHSLWFDATPLSRGPPALAAT